jgi:hypothetical protein
MMAEDLLIMSGLSATSNEGTLVAVEIRRYRKVTATWNSAWLV